MPSFRDELTSGTLADCPLIRYLDLASERTLCSGGRGSEIEPLDLVLCAPPSSKLSTGFWY